MIRIRDYDECCVGIYRTRGVTDSSNLVFFVTPNIPISMRSYMRLCSTEKTPSPKRPYARCGIQRLSRSSSNGSSVLDPHNSLIVLYMYHRASTGASVDGFGIGLSSEPAPLSALFRPVKEK